MIKFFINNNNIKVKINKEIKREDKVSKKDKILILVILNILGIFIGRYIANKYIKSKESQELKDLYNNKIKKYNEKMFQFIENKFKSINELNKSINELNDEQYCEEINKYIEECNNKIKTLKNQKEFIDDFARFQKLIITKINTLNDNNLNSIKNTYNNILNNFYNILINFDEGEYECLKKYKDCLLNELTGEKNKKYDSISEILRSVYSIKKKFEDLDNLQGISTYSTYPALLLYDFTTKINKLFAELNDAIINSN